MEASAQRAAAAPVDPRRGRMQVLAVLQEVVAPLPVSAVAEHVGLHLNTARFHLEHLVRQGLVERTVEPRTTPGRPRNLYRAVHRPSVEQRSYRLLAEILARSLTEPVTRPAQAACAAGRLHGRTMVDPVPGRRRSTVGTAVAGLVDVLDDVGFAPELVTAGRGRRILLRHCPFLEAARQNTEVVCAVHLGLMQGVLDTLRAPVVAERLEPFVTPDLCIAHLASRRPRRAVAAAS